MAFDITKMAQTGGSLSNKDVPVGWSYISSTDALINILSSAYFDGISDQLSQYDYIYVRGSDGSDWITVTSATGTTPVTVLEF